MKKILITLFVFCSFSVFAQSKTEQQIWKNVEALNTAIFVNKDSVALDKLLRADVSYSHSGGNIETKAVMIAHAVKNVTTYRNVGMDKISIQVLKSTAIVRHQFNAIQKDKDGMESELHLGVLQVWINEKGEWKLIARQSVKVNNK
jgi:hypothetical protein